jgi:hypothetical protein
MYVVCIQFGHAIKFHEVQYPTMATLLVSYGGLPWLGGVAEKAAGMEVLVLQAPPQHPPTAIIGA